MAASLVLTPQKFTALDSDQLAGKKDIKKTDAEPTEEEQQQRLTSSSEIQQKWTIKNKNDLVPPSYQIYSAAYISFYTAKLIDDIVSDLSEWQLNGTEDSLVNISNIKTILEKNYEYLQERSENRIFLSYLETIFKDGNWEYLTQDQVGFIKNQLNDFKSGDINFQNLENFSKKLYMQNLGIDKRSSNEKKTKAKKTDK